MSDMEDDGSNQDCSPSIPPNPDCIAPMLGKNDASIFSQFHHCWV